jgi:hypothetical protein
MSCCRGVRLLFIVLFHFVLNPKGIPLAVIMTASGLVLLAGYRQQYMALLRN